MHVSFKIQFRPYCFYVECGSAVLSLAGSNVLWTSQPFRRTKSCMLGVPNMAPEVLVSLILISRWISVLCWEDRRASREWWSQATAPCIYGIYTCRFNQPQVRITGEKAASAVRMFRIFLVAVLSRTQCDDYLHSISPMLDTVSKLELI